MYFHAKSSCNSILQSLVPYVPSSLDQSVLLYTWKRLVLLLPQFVQNVAVVLPCGKSDGRVRADPSVVVMEAPCAAVALAFRDEVGVLEAHDGDGDDAWEVVLGLLCQEEEAVQSFEDDLSVGAGAESFEMDDVHDRAASVVLVLAAAAYLFLALAPSPGSLFLVEAVAVAHDLVLAVGRMTSVLFRRLCHDHQSDQALLLDH
jgi:hypothetical protein